MMNRTGAEDTEKKKKRHSPHWRYLRLLTIPVAIFLVVFLSLVAVWYIYNLQQYNSNRRLWDEGNHGEVLFQYLVSEGSAEDLSWNPMPHFVSAEGWWSIASNCLYQVFCKITYHDEYHYPKYIEQFLGEWHTKAGGLIICAKDEDTRRYCDEFLPYDQ
jgi:hypothetical protein